VLLFHTQQSSPAAFRQSNLVVKELHTARQPCDACEGLSTQDAVGAGDGGLGLHAQVWLTLAQSAFVFSDSHSGLYAAPAPGFKVHPPLLRRAQPTRCVSLQQCSSTVVLVLAHASYQGGLLSSGSSPLARRAVKNHIGAEK
jgi:hypothetical protein